MSSAGLFLLGTPEQDDPVTVTRADQKRVMKDKGRERPLFPSFIRQDLNGRVTKRCQARCNNELKNY